VSDTAYLTTADALAQINECERKGIIVLGVDVFTITPGETRPHMDLTLDMSCIRNAAQAAQAAEGARGHIQKFSQLHYRYEIVTDI
jgi:hypothetical protein